MKRRNHKNLLSSKNAKIDNIYHCSTCDYQTNRLFNLQTHERSCTDFQLRYQCLVCSQDFSHLSTFKKHFRQHQKTLITTVRVVANDAKDGKCQCLSCLSRNHSAKIHPLPFTGVFIGGFIRSIFQSNHLNNARRVKELMDRLVHKRVQSPVGISKIDHFVSKMMERLSNPAEAQKVRDQILNWIDLAKQCRKLSNAEQDNIYDSYGLIGE